MYILKIDGIIKTIFTLRCSFIAIPCIISHTYMRARLYRYSKRICYSEVAIFVII